MDRSSPAGLRFDPQKVLLDPYGRAVAVPIAYNRMAAAQPGDNAAHAMKSVVTDSGRYDWQGDRPLRHSYASTAIYEMHAAGFTRHPNSGVCPANEAPMPDSWRRYPTWKIWDHGCRITAGLPVRSLGLPGGTGQLLGILPGVFLCAASRLQLAPGSAGRDG